MEITEELRACLALQNEIASKRDELMRRLKAVIEGERAKGNNGRISAIIDGVIYVLRRSDMETEDTAEVIESARKLGGFWNYKIVKIGKPVD
jgi:hypothetical protein